MTRLTLLVALTLHAAAALRTPPRGTSLLARRDALSLFGATAATLTAERPTAAAAAVAAPAGAAATTTTTAPRLRDLVESLRGWKDDARPPLITKQIFTRETADVLYPPWFAGTWRCTSTLESVLAPAGVELFTPGRNGTEALRRARLEVGQPLQYSSRWRKGDEEGSWVVDRGFNVAAISVASMGEKAVQNCEEYGPDRIELVLRPDAAGRVVYRAQLDVVARRTDPAVSDALFDCAETVRQTVVLVPGEGYNGPTRPPMVKEVETVCTYDRTPSGAIVGTQRTATFLVPDAAYTSGASLAEQQVRVRPPSGKPLPPPSRRASPSRVLLGRRSRWHEDPMASSRRSTCECTPSSMKRSRLLAAFDLWIARRGAE